MSPLVADRGRISCQANAMSEGPTADIEEPTDEPAVGTIAFGDSK
jgi:hypothetical protein